MGCSKRPACKFSRYFGQYGKILKIALSPGTATPPGTSAPPAHSCYITYANRDEAEQAILAVDGVVLDGRTLKASFGTPMRYAQLSDKLELSRDLDDAGMLVAFAPPRRVPLPPTPDVMCAVHRTPYDEANAVFVTPDPSECVAIKPRHFAAHTPRLHQKPCFPMSLGARDMP